jgi:dolichol-phosphate mannosyltransferase
MKLLSIILSFRNEEETIPEMVKRIDNTLKGIANWNYELIYVNDFSNDQSEAILLDKQKDYPITIINLSRNFGNTPSVIAGLNEAKGDAIIYMDADLQDPPELIPELIKKYELGNDVVHTRRLKRLGEEKHKLAFTSFAYKIIAFFSSSIVLPKNVGDFKLLSNKALKHLLSLKEQDPYLRGLSVWIGFDQEFVDYVRQPRFGGKSKYNFFTLGPYAEFVRGITSFSNLPLYFGVFLGALSLFVCLGLIIYSFYIKISGKHATGVPGILIAISFFSGIILFNLGIIGVYLAKIYDQVKGRPKYIIKNIKKF